LSLPGGWDKLRLLARDLRVDTAADIRKFLQKSDCKSLLLIEIVLPRKIREAQDYFMGDKIDHLNEKQSV
jgi:hypothetical protein